MPRHHADGAGGLPAGVVQRVEYDTPTFRWDPVDGAGWYRVYLATDPLFTNITKTYDTMFTSLTPSESLPDSQAGQATYWFVRPCYTTSYCGPFDESVFGQARAFRKVTRPVEDLAATLPTPSGPGAPVDNSVMFTWKDYLATNRLDQTATIAPTAPAVDLEAASYQLQVSTTSNFTAIIDNVTAIDQTTYVGAHGHLRRRAALRAGPGLRQDRQPADVERPDLVHQVDPCPERPAPRLVAHR